MGNLPVYSDVRHFRQNKVTIVRKFAGDRHALASEIERVTGSPVKHYNGRLEVRGMHTQKLKQWLEGLGF